MFANNIGSIVCRVAAYSNILPNSQIEQIPLKTKMKELRYIAYTPFIINSLLNLNKMAILYYYVLLTNCRL